MTRSLTSLLASAAALAAPATPSFAGTRSELPPPYTASCHAIDGDTLRCGPVRIRLLGIDAAELPGHCRQGRDCAPGDPYAQWNQLAALVTGTLTIRPVKFDNYGRQVALVTNAFGFNLSCAMLGVGATYKPQWDDGGRIASLCFARR